MKGGGENQQLLQARRDGAAELMEADVLNPPVSLVVPVIPGPTWASGPRGLLG